MMAGPGAESGFTPDPDLERAYNCRAAVPEHPEIFDRWSRESADARAWAGRLLRRDVRYGQGGRRTMDVFGAGMTALPRPALIFLHGGYWQAMDKSVFGFLAPPFVKAGASVVIPNYPLCPTEPLPNIINAVREAIQVLWQDASILGLDRHRFVVAGHSAGGHLTAQMLCTRWPSVDSAMPVDTLKGGIAISGLFDLQPLVRTTINGALRLDEAAARRASPLFADPLPGASLTLAVGDRESDAFHDQSVRLMQRWAGQGAHATWFPLPGRHHFSAVEALADPGQALFHDALGRLGLTWPEDGQEA
jgi:arylformamidase